MARMSGEARIGGDHSALGTNFFIAKTLPNQNPKLEIRNKPAKTKFEV